MCVSAVPAGQVSVRRTTSTVVGCVLSHYLPLIVGGGNVDRMPCLVPRAYDS